MDTAGQIDEQSQTSVIYGWLRQRALAILVDLWFNALIIPIFLSIYYYFRDGQTIGYKVMWLTIYQYSSEENVKPTKIKLLIRWLLQWAVGLYVLSIVWFLFSLTFFVIDVGWWEIATDSLLNVIRWSINWILWILGLISLALLLINIVAILMHEKKRWMHDRLAWTVVHKIRPIKIWWMILWLVLIGLWDAIWSIIETGL